jgi:hypothetical protein
MCNAERAPSRPFGRWEVEIEVIVETRGEGEEMVRHSGSKEEPEF